MNYLLLLLKPGNDISLQAECLFVYRQSNIDERESMLVSLCDEIYLKDIKDRKGVRDMDVFSDFLVSLLQI